MVLENKLVKDNRLVIEIDFDLLLDEYTPQICKALAKRRKILHEIKECKSTTKSDLGDSIISIVRKSREPEEAAKNLSKELKLSKAAAKFLLDCPLEKPGWHCDERLIELEQSLQLLGVKQ